MFLLISIISIIFLLIVIAHSCNFTETNNDYKQENISKNKYKNFETAQTPKKRNTPKDKYSYKNFKGDSIVKLLLNYWEYPDRDEYTEEEIELAEYLDYIFYITPREKETIQERVSNGEGLINIIGRIYEEANIIIGLLLSKNRMMNLLDGESDGEFASYSIYFELYYQFWNQTYFEFFLIRLYL